jgi:hypothetical protein
MLDALVGIVTGLLVLAAILVILGPQTKTLLRRVRSVKPKAPALPMARPARDVAPVALNPKTQRVLVSATRLSQWLRGHGQDEVARELRAAAARLATDEPTGLYAMQNALRRLRSVELDDRSSNERLRLLSTDLRKAVQDRFEQLELLPFGHS